MRIIGHHTCSGQGDVAEIEKQGPFYSTHDSEDSSNFKFLGSGYYFWDNNIGMAHSFGQSRYKRKYYIFEAELLLEDDYFLDLAGNRIDMLHFQEIMKKMHEKAEQTKTWTIAHFIEFLQRKGAFHYLAIRAIDTSITPKDVFKFVPDKNSYTNLNPIFIVCLLSDGKQFIKSFIHLKTFPSNEI